MKRTKKLLALALTAALAISTMAPVFAEDTALAPTDGRTGTMELSPSVIGPTVSVVADAGKKNVVLNPYKLKVDVTTSAKATDSSDEANIVDDSVISSPLYILNLGDTDISIVPSVTVTAAKGVTLTTVPYTSDLLPEGSKLVPKAVTTKSAFMYLKSGVCTWDATADSGKELKAPFADKKYDATKDLILKAGANAIKNPILLHKLPAEVTAPTFAVGDTLDGVAAAEWFGTSNSSTPLCEIQIVGEANGQADWGDSDTIAATIAWTITPTVIPAPAAG